MNNITYSFENLYKIFMDELLQQKFSKSPKELYEPIIYTINQSGKRLRPIFTLMSCNLFCDDINKAMPQALAVELLHNFTLIHDDIMDDAPLRHGQKTVHTKWNKNLAILAGDTMYALAYRFAMQCELKKLPIILKTFNDTALEACEGQQMDINFENKSLVGKPDYMLMIKYKTAVLFGASMRIGAILGNANEKDIDLLTDFGNNIGMAFQLKDDLLDVYGEQQKFGKQTGLDIVESKKTFLYISALERADETTKEKLMFVYRKNNPNPEEKVKDTKAIFDSLDIESYTEQIISDYVNKSLQKLDLVNVNKERKAGLEDLANRLIYRSK